MRTMLHQALQLKQNCPIQEAQAIAYLKNDNIEMVSIMKQQVRELHQANLQLSDKNAQLIKFKTKIDGQQKIIVELQKEVESYKFRDPFTQTGKKQGLLTTEIENLKVELEKKFLECNQLNNTVMVREKRIVEVERRMKELQMEYQVKIENLEWERNEMRSKISSLLNEMQNVQTSSINQSSIKRRNSILDPFERKDRKLSSKVNHIEEDRHELEDDSDDDPRKMTSVKKLDVIDLGRMLKYKLRLQKIPFQDVDKQLFGQSTLISIEQIRDSLIELPFQLEEQDALLIARYLVEDNEDKDVMYTQTLTASVPRVRSILKNLLSNYTILTNEENEILKQEVTILLNKNKSGVISHLSKDKSAKKNTQDIKNLHRIQEFLDALAQAEIIMNQRQLDYIYQQNYEITKSVQEINIIQLYQRFRPQSTKHIQNPSLNFANIIDESSVKNPLEDTPIHVPSIAELNKIANPFIQCESVMHTSPKSNSNANLKWVESLNQLSRQPSEAPKLLKLDSFNAMFTAAVSQNKIPLDLEEIQESNLRESSIYQDQYKFKPSNDDTNKAQDEEYQLDQEEMKQENQDMYEEDKLYEEDQQQEEEKQEEKNNQQQKEQRQEEEKQYYEDDEEQKQQEEEKQQELEQLENQLEQEQQEDQNDDNDDNLYYLEDEKIQKHKQSDNNQHYNIIVNSYHESQQPYNLNVELE